MLVILMWEDNRGWIFSPKEALLGIMDLYIDQLAKMP